MSAITMTLPKRYHAASIWALYAIGLAPAAWYFYLGATGQLGADPVKTFERFLGLWALRFILMTLAITPLRDIAGINWLRYRRALGLLAFYYVLMHLSVYMILDQALVLQTIVADVLRRPFISIGMAAFVLLIPLAVTSNRWSIRSMGRNWSRLHMLIYLIAAAGALHYAMSVKVITLEPAIYIALVALLLAWRPVRTRYNRWKRAQPGTPRYTRSG